MGSDTTRREREQRILSWREDEIWYVVDRLHERYPDELRQVIQRFVDQTKSEVHRSEGHGKLLDKAECKLKKTKQTSE